MRETAIKRLEAMEALLQREGIPYTVHEHAPIHTLADIEANLPFPPERMLKTIAFEAGERWVLVALHAYSSIDYGAVARALGIKRSELRPADPDRLNAALGFERGGVSPLAPDATVIFDSDAVSLGTVVCGAARNDRTLEVDIDALIRLSGGSLASIGKGPSLTPRQGDE
jgi:prolyl-tRNA editing enzyme YbaK/EbsC (Cys-tRNA(Pro) deacylase)